MLGLRAVRFPPLFVLCLCAFVTPIFSQEPTDRSEGRKPLILKVDPNLSKKDTGPSEIESLQVLASRLLNHAPDAGCHPNSCKILVTDFVFPDGFTSAEVVRWADDLSSFFAADGRGIRVPDRNLLKRFLEKEPMPAELKDSESVARWLGSEFGATVVSIGQASMVREDVVQLSARFVNVNDDRLIGPSSEVNLQINASEVGLHPISEVSDHPPHLPFPDTVNGEKVYRAGVNGVTAASCFYMPNRPFTEAARKAKFSGRLVVEAAVGTDGAVKAARILKGAPYGVNDIVLKTVETWKCKPALLDEKPAATVVPFEITFRLY